MMPNQGIYEYNELGIQMPTYFTPINGPQGSYPNIFNPVALADLGSFKISAEKIIPHLLLSITPNSTFKVIPLTWDLMWEMIAKKNSLLRQLQGKLV